MTDAGKQLRLRLRLIRERKKLNVREVAELVGVSHQTISAWERGYRAPGLDDIERWTAALGVGVAVIVVEDSPPRSPAQEAAEILASMTPEMQEMLLAQIRAAADSRLRRTG